MAEPRGRRGRGAAVASSFLRGKRGERHRDARGARARGDLCPASGFFLLAAAAAAVAPDLDGRSPPSPSSLIMLWNEGPVALQGAASQESLLATTSAAGPPPHPGPPEHPRSAAAAAGEDTEEETSRQPAQKSISEIAPTRAASCAPRTYSTF